MSDLFPSFGQWIKEHYYTSALPTNDYKKYWLINKYQDKVSQRLLDEKTDLLDKGSKAFGDLLLEAYSRPNPFLVACKTQEHNNIWNQPVILGVEHGVVFKNEKD